MMPVVRVAGLVKIIELGKHERIVIVQLRGEKYVRNSLQTGVFHVREMPTFSMSQ